MACGFYNGVSFLLQVRAAFPAGLDDEQKKARRSGPFYVAAASAYLNS
jgi:hypothetical protein